MNAQTPTIGHNQPPPEDPIDVATAPFEGVIEEAGHWLDGEPIHTETQMRAAEQVLAGIKEARRAIDAARKVAVAPLYDRWKVESDRWKPVVDDLSARHDGLVALIDPMKRQIAAEKAEAERQARIEADIARRKAEEARASADPTDLLARQEADAAARDAADAAARAAAMAATREKGLRTHTDYVVVDAVAFARWLWANARDDLMEWMGDYARRRKLAIPGVVEARTERRAV